MSLLGAVGTRGGIVRRSKPTGKYVAADAAIASARAVLIDSSVPWDFCSADRCRSLPFRRMGRRIEQGRLAASRAGLSGRVDRCSHRADFGDRDLRGSAMPGQAVRGGTECRAVSRQLRSHSDRHRTKSFTPVAQILFHGRTGTVDRTGSNASREARLGSETRRATVERSGLGRRGAAIPQACDAS